MTDEEALKEIDRQEKRLAAAKCGRGLRLVNSAREYYETMIGLRKEAAKAEAGRAVPPHRQGRRVPEEPGAHGANPLRGENPLPRCAEGRVRRGTT